MNESAIPTFDNTYAGLGAGFSSSLAPTAVSKPGLIRINHEIAVSLGFDPIVLASEQGLNVLAGNALFEGMEPIATVYAGHQFGQFNPQLGDGRAILLGEVVRQDGQRFDIQLKGAGPTPYSRGGDGRAPLGPVLREYIVSEAMAAMGIPTTRSLAAVTTGELVYREEPLWGAVLTRVASSHIRIGTFQFFAAKGMLTELRQLADHVIGRHFPEIAGGEKPYLNLLQKVLHRQAELVAKWQNIGFIHGVMNTDNVLLSGETIDYGPCAFLDEFKPEKVFSSIDRGGRYAFENQPSIAHWNVMNLAQTLLPLIDENTEHAVAQAQEVVDQFPILFESAYQRGINRKLGLRDDAVAGLELGQNFLQLLASSKIDFTLAFRRLAEMRSESIGVGQDFGDPVIDLFNFPGAFNEWIGKWQQTISQSDLKADDLDMIYRENPVFVPRNHLIEEAILAAYQDDFGLFEQLLNRVTDPFNYKREDIKFASPPLPEQVVQQTFCGT